MLITFKRSHTLAEVITRLVNASGSILAGRRNTLVNVKFTCRACDRKYDTLVKMLRCLWDQNEQMPQVRSCDRDCNIRSGWSEYTETEEPRGFMSTDVGFNLEGYLTVDAWIGYSRRIMYVCTLVSKGSVLILAASFWKLIRFTEPVRLFPEQFSFNLS